MNMSSLSDSSEDEWSRKRKRQERRRKRTKPAIKKAKSPGRRAWPSKHSFVRMSRWIRPLGLQKLAEKTKASIVKGHKNLLKRQKWLVIADDHGLAVEDRLGGQWPARGNPRRTC